jgi:hypothetical protein
VLLLLSGLPQQLPLLPHQGHLLFLCLLVVVLLLDLLLLVLVLPADVQRLQSATGP